MEQHHCRSEMCYTYAPEVNKQLYLLIAVGQCNCMSQTTKEGTTVSQNGTPFIISKQKLGKLHTFNMVLIKNHHEQLQQCSVIIPYSIEEWDTHTNV